jgi:hypothetical protein
VRAWLLLSPQFVEPDDAHQTLIIRDASASPPDGAAVQVLADEPLRAGKQLDGRRSTAPWNTNPESIMADKGVGHRQGSRCRREHCAARERTLLHPLNLAHNTTKASITGSQLRRLMPVNHLTTYLRR